MIGEATSMFSAGIETTIHGIARQAREHYQRNRIIEQLHGQIIERYARHDVSKEARAENGTWTKGGKKIDRTTWGKEHDACWLCGSRGSDTAPLQTHEIARGPARQAALKHPAAWLRTCNDCHAKLPDVAGQLALKRRHDEEYYDRVAVNQLRGRQPEAITEADVDEAEKKLLVSHERYSRMLARQTIERYARIKAGAGQKSLFGDEPTSGAQRKLKWKEEDHPREADGEFAKKGEGEAKSSSTIREQSAEPLDIDAFNSIPRAGAETESRKQPETIYQDQRMSMVYPVANGIGKSALITINGKKVFVQPDERARPIPSNLVEKVKAAGLDPQKYVILGTAVVPKVAADKLAVIGRANRENRSNDTKAKAQQLRDNVPGLKELEAAYDDEDRYRREFSKMMSDGDNDGDRPPKPVVLAAQTVAQQYPRAAAYLKAEQESRKASMAEAGEKAMELIGAGGPLEEATAILEAASKAATVKHAWD